MQSTPETALETRRCSSAGAFRCRADWSQTLSEAAPGADGAGSRLMGQIPASSFCQGTLWGLLLQGRLPWASLGGDQGQTTQSHGHMVKCNPMPKACFAPRLCTDLLGADPGPQDPHPQAEKGTVSSLWTILQISQHAGIEQPSPSSFQVRGLQIMCLPIPVLEI